LRKPLVSLVSNINLNLRNLHTLFYSCQSYVAALHFGVASDHTYACSGAIKAELKAVSMYYSDVGIPVVDVSHMAGGLLRTMPQTQIRIMSLLPSDDQTPCTQIGAWLSSRAGMQKTRGISLCARPNPRPSYRHLPMS